MLKRVILVGAAVAAFTTQASAWEYVHTKCITNDGSRIEAIVKKGKAVVRHENYPWAVAYTKRDGDIGTITQIGTKGVMTLSSSLTNGRAYVITSFNDGRREEAPARCTHTAK